MARRRWCRRLRCSRAHLPAAAPCPLPPLPQELCGIWAYIKWEQAGCPNRSKEEADREYEASIQELVALLRRWAGQASLLR